METLTTYFREIIILFSISSLRRLVFSRIKTKNSKKTRKEITLSGLPIMEDIKMTAVILSGDLRALIKNT
jgi:hypothetical protein